MRVFGRRQKEDATLEQLVLQAQSGNEEVRHTLLKDYRPFIATSVSKVCKRYIDQTHDDEFSVGWMAFNEAIDSFETDQGSKFLTFARLVISRKVIDFIRSQKIDMKTVSLDAEDPSGEQSNESYLHDLSKKQYVQDELAWYRQIEIEEYQKVLKEYGLSFNELVEHSPKHRDAKEQAQQIAHLVYENEEIRQYIIEKKRLPIKKILPLVDVSKKTIERNRKYILAVFILLKEDFVYLKEYVKEV